VNFRRVPGECSSVPLSAMIVDPIANLNAWAPLLSSNGAHFLCFR
jgi:hypothetical protein